MTISTENLIRHLVELTQKLMVKDGIEDILELAPLTTQNLIPCQGCSILLFDKETSGLYFNSVSGEKKDDLKKITIQKGHGIAGWVAENREAVIVNNVGADKRFDNKLDTQLNFTTQKLMASPLVAHEEMIGVIEVVNKNDDADFNNDDLQILGIIGDIVSAAIHSAQLRQVKSRTDRLATVGMSVSGILHDLRNPLTSIVGFAQLLKGKDERTDEFVNIILNDAHYMADLLEDWLDVSRGDVVIKKKQTDITRLLQENSKHLEQSCKIEGVTLKQEFTFTGSLNLDQSKFMRAVRNLTSNALKAMDDGGTLSLQTDHFETNCRLRISDTGNGITKDLQKNLFEPFYTSDKHSGTGLGLAISKKIIELHGGSITFESTMNQGTEFTILLPC